MADTNHVKPITAAIMRKAAHRLFLSMHDIFSELGVNSIPNAITTLVYMLGRLGAAGRAPGATRAEIFYRTTSGETARAVFDIGFSDARRNADEWQEHN